MAEKNDLQEQEDNKEINKKYLQLAFAIFISGTVTYVLKSLLTYIPGDMIGSLKWFFSSLIIILSALGIIFYILDYFPKFSNKDIWMKTFLLIFSSMTFLNFCRYHFFINTIGSDNTAFTEIIDWSYNSWLLFFGVCGVILIKQAGIYPKKQDYILHRGLFYLIGIMIIILAIAIKLFISPYGGGS